MNKHIFKHILVGSCAVMAMTSCDDFLTITPTDRIVEEEFWENKGDLQSVVNSCYIKLTDGAMMQRYLLWGEARSDNFTKRTGENWQNMTNLENANLLPTNGMFNWEDPYKEINFCNKVLKHGPEVVAADESFSDGQWQPIRAEVMTLRAFSHFLLVRTFGEIPYVTSEYNNDGQNLRLAQSTQQEVLDSIIMDLEEVKDLAMEDYGNTVENKGRITRKTVYSLLADVYLWRASKNASPDSVAKYGNLSVKDYERCVECCDYVLNAMLAERTKQLNRSGLVLGGVTTPLTLEDLLITNDDQSTSRYALQYGAYAHLFGSGNSTESIFELQFDGTNTMNTLVNGIYWNFSDGITGRIVCTEALVGSFLKTPNDPIPASLYTITDYRKWENVRFVSASQAEYPVNKYVTIGPSYPSVTNGLITDNSKFTAVINNTRAKTTSANWIIYRLSDVMLMKAEALSQLYQDEDHLKEAFSLVRDIFKRSNPYAYSMNNKTAANDSLQYDGFNTQEGMEALIMAERQREFFGEGKRWFDLVRYAQRKGNTATMLKNFLTRKYSSNTGAISAKLNTIQSLFCPIYQDELKSNELLHQNSVWATNESTSKTDEL